MSSTMSFYPLDRVRRKLPYLYLILLPSGILIIYLYSKIHQFTDLHLWYLFPLWFALGIILCGFSFMITGLSYKDGWAIIHRSHLFFTKRGSLVHLQTVFLISFFEEIIFRYVLIFFLYDLINSYLISVILSSLLFSAIHFRFGWGSRTSLRYVDLFILSVLLCVVNLLTGSIYPSIILHGMRNFILRISMIPKI